MTVDVLDLRYYALLEPDSEAVRYVGETEQMMRFVIECI
jgi:hypothetical protein